jgi:hypothetical protein
MLKTAVCKVLDFYVFVFIIFTVSRPEELLFLLLAQVLNGANELLNHLLTIY